MHKIEKSQVMFAGKVFTAKTEEIILPNRKKAIREVAVHPGGASMVAVIENKIVLVKQYRHAAQSYILEIPAGLLEKGETPMDCAIRELKEETGYTARKVRHLTSVYMSVGYSTEINHIYLGEDLVPGSQELDPGEDVEIVLMEAEQVLKRIFSGEIADSKTAIGVLGYLTWR